MQENQSIGDGLVTFVIVSHRERNRIARSREAQQSSSNGMKMSGLGK